MTEERCGTCRFWPRYPYAETNDLSDAGLTGGPKSECRRRAPTSAEPGDVRQWPWTNATDWCGEFEHRVNAALAGVAVGSISRADFYALQRDEPNEGDRS